MTGEASLGFSVRRDVGPGGRTVTLVGRASWKEPKWVKLMEPTRG